MVRFGVDSSPVVNALNTLSSRDPRMMPMLRAIADASIEHSFMPVSVHVTRGKNLLADAGTRHATVQDFLPFLAAEGFSAKACSDTAARFQSDSALSNGQTLSLSLGPRKRWR